MTEGGQMGGQSKLALLGRVSSSEEQELQAAIAETSGDKRVPEARGVPDSSGNRRVNWPHLRSDLAASVGWNTLKLKGLLMTLLLEDGVT